MAVQQVALEVGQAVRIASAPKEWMEPLVNQTGTVGAIRRNEHLDAYRVDGIPAGPVWFTEKHLERVQATEEERSAL